MKTKQEYGYKPCINPEPATPVKSVAERQAEWARTHPLGTCGPAPEGTASIRVQDPRNIGFFQPTRRKDWSFNDSEYQKEVRRNRRAARSKGDSGPTARDKRVAKFLASEQAKGMSEEQIALVLSLL